VVSFIQTAGKLQLIEKKAFLISLSDKIANAQLLAKYIRVKSLIMVSGANSSHIGSCLSVADLVAAVQITNQNTSNELILSKGHAAAAIYSSLAGLKLIPEDLLSGFGSDGSELIGHVNHLVDGITFSTGSLGHGLPLGVGVAIASKQKHVYVIISDGELNEGTTWESLAIASQLNLSNLTLIIDANGIQSFGTTIETVNLEPLKDKFVSFGWNCFDVDGHSIPTLFEAIESNSNYNPKVIIARTIKGKGVSEMEGKLEWHYKSPKKGDLNNFINEVSGNA
jgi:transketolase